MTPLSRNQIAWRLAQDIQEGDYVNLGSGMPLMVSDYVPKQREVIFHSENGLLGIGPKQTQQDKDMDLINAGNIPVTLLPGGAFFNHVDSFTMIRGGHLDISVLGAYQVSETGDLANWDAPSSRKAPAVGGAMDLAIGAKKVFVMMNYFTRDGVAKLVKKCQLPLTGLKCVSTIYTDIAILDIANGQIIVRELIDGLNLAELREKTEVKLEASANIKPLSAPALE